MKNHEQQTRTLIAEQAAYWFVENREILDSKTRDEFIGWLRTSPVHVEEYLALAALTPDLVSACELAGESIDSLVADAREESSTVTALPPFKQAASSKSPLRPWRLIGLAASLSALVIGAIVFRHGGPSRGTVPPDAAQHLITGHGEQRTYRLADHSVVHLNTDTAVTVRIDSNRRFVVLERGEAVFEVVHEQQRPFRVSAGPAQVEDVGTTFDVRVFTGSAQVTVVAGQVNLWLTKPLAQASTPMVLIAGQQARVADGIMPPRPIAVDIARQTAWLHRQINFQNEPLGLVTDEFNRYAQVPYQIDSQTLRNLKISGSFTIDDREAFIAFLRSLPSVHVYVTPTQVRISQD